MSCIIHTADWHLGARLAGEERQDEQAAFLGWLSERMGELHPDMLIVAGDVFDAATPPQSALSLYYRFLADLRTASPCCRVLILGGNHDSPAMLEAPRELLSALNITVVGTSTDDPCKSILELDDCVVCAVPFLRERDLRSAAPGQSAEDIAAAIREGIARRYREALEAANAVANGRPVIATGHLAALGTQNSLSERSIYIGNLGAVAASCFDGFAYAALGHIHHAQAVGHMENVRYAGSPLALDFSEAAADKEIRIVTVVNGVVSSEPLPIPTFRPLLRMTTNSATLAGDLAAKQAVEGAAFEPWAELTVTDAREHPDIERLVQDEAAKLRLKVLKIIVPRAKEEVEADATAGRTLADLKPEDVFAERMRRKGIEAGSESWNELSASFNMLLEKMREGDIGGEGGRA